MTNHDYAAVFVSDVHLGSPGCKPKALVEFLRTVTCRQLYLVGDVLDLWMVGGLLRCSNDQVAVIRALLDHARRGTQVRYLLGNHDRMLVRFLEGIQLGTVSVARSHVHRTADGKHLLVVHGDRKDLYATHAEWLCRCTAYLYHGLMWLNSVVNRILRALGIGGKDFSKPVKQAVKGYAVERSGVRDLLVSTAREAGCDGIVCGHLHQPEIRQMGEMLYCNTGDWVESCTLVVEHGDGRLELLELGETAPAAERAPVPVTASLEMADAAS